MTNVFLTKFFLFLPSNKLLGLWEYWNVLSATHCPRVWITVSNSSSVFSRLCKHDKKVSYCLKVKVFPQFSDAGEISELIIEMAFILKWVLEVHEPCNEKLWSASRNSSVSPSVVHQTFWSGERWSTRINCSYFLRYVTNIRDWRYYPTICLLFPVAEQEPTLINCGYWQDKKIYFTQVRRILFTVGSVDRSIARYSGR